MTDVHRNKQLQSSSRPAVGSVPLRLDNGSGVVGKKMDVADVIRRARAKRGWSQVRLAKETGTTRQSVSAWEKGKTRPGRENAPKVAAKLGIPLSSISADPAQLNVEFFETGAHTGSRVPILTWIEAGLGAEVVASHALDTAHEFIDARQPVSKETFALRVRGKSMEPEFREGDIIIVDPMVIPVADEFVVAELLPKGVEPGQGEPVLKQYRPRRQNGAAPAFDLIPLNPEFQTITVNQANPGRIIGTVVESTRNHKLR